MIPDLKEKVILITGASTGIGAAVARAFAAEGARVALHYNRSESAARDLEGELRDSGADVRLVKADLSQSGEPARVVAHSFELFGRLDVLVNNAGSMIERRTVAESSDALLDEVLRTNVTSLVAASRAAIPHFRRQGFGNIINTTSVAARNGGGPGAVLYAASKGFVSTFTRGLAKEVVRDGIRVNAVAPGVILTPFHERFTNEAQLQALKVTIPMGRVGIPDECTGAYLYLASDRLSGYVTGQVIEVNGGQLMP